MSEVSLKEINRIAIPAIFAGISEPLISLGDAAILGQLPDKVEIMSGIANATAFYLTIVWVLAQMKSAISSMVSRFLGKDNLDELRHLVPQTILMSFILGCVFMIITLPGIEWLMGELYGLDGNALDYSVSYYKIRAIGFPFVLAAFTIFGVFRGLQNTWWPMVISLSCGIINLILDYILVLGVDGVYAGMGSDGAAWASLAVQVLMFIAALILLKIKTPFRWELGRKLDFHLKELSSLAGNLILRTIALNFTILLCHRYATSYSNAHNAAHSIAYNIWIFAAFFIDGYSNAANAIGGKLKGAKDFVKMQSLMQKILKFNIGIAVGLSLVLSLFYYRIGPFFNDNPDVVRLFESVFWVMLLLLPINAVAFSMDGLFKGFGEGKFLRNVLFVASFAVFAPLLLVSDSFELKLYSVWIALAGWMLVRAIMPYIRYHRMLHKHS